MTSPHLAYLLTNMEAGEGVGQKIEVQVTRMSMSVGTMRSFSSSSLTAPDLDVGEKCERRCGQEVLGSLSRDLGLDLDLDIGMDLDPDLESYWNANITLPIDSSFRVKKIDQRRGTDEVMSQYSGSRSPYGSRSSWI